MNHIIGKVPLVIRGWGVAAIVLAACSTSSSEPAHGQGRIVVAISIDWEGAYFSPDGLDAMDALRDQIPGAPITHFVCAAYFSKEHPDSTALVSLRSAVQPGDELAMHLHGWKSLAVAAKLEPKLSPSFLSGTEQLLEFEDDRGFDTDLDVYSVSELRALLRTSRRLLEPVGIPISTTFRAGGYLGTPKMLQAIFEEGYTVDSSATDHRQLEEQQDGVLPERIHELWPKIDASAAPYAIEVTGGELLELPIAAIADYATSKEITALFDQALARVKADPTRDAIVVLGFHQETAQEFAPRLVEALTSVRARPELASRLVYLTVAQAAELARAQVTAR